MQTSRFLALLYFFSTFSGAAEWQNLLDKNLSQWDTYLSYKHTENYDGNIPLDAQGNAVSPIGLNTGNDVHQVFTVIEEDQQNVLRVSGEIYGAVTSKQSYRNYHLKLQFRWGDLKWQPRLHKLKDSGILYHGTGEHGQEYFRSWMLSQEFQIMEGHIGDYWSQATSAIDIRAYQPEYVMNAVADESQDYSARHHLHSCHSPSCHPFRTTKPSHAPVDHARGIRQSGRMPCHTLIPIPVRSRRCRKRPL